MEHGLVPTGVPGLDEVLFGGLPPRGIYYVGGEPGTGKTTLGLQFLIEGIARGETALFITISQDRRDLERIAASHGFDISDVSVAELSAPEIARTAAERQSVLATSDVELTELAAGIRDAIESVGPQRIVLDSLLEIRLLAEEPLKYRRELVLLRDEVVSRAATGLLLDCPDASPGDRQLPALANGAIFLEQEVPSYGAVLRRLHVAKMRGHEFVDGPHDLAIQRGGLAVFPRVVPELATTETDEDFISSGISALDDMLGGGLESGTACLITGQSGTGKSTLATAYAHAASEVGTPAAMFLFEERPEVFRRRSDDLGFAIGKAQRSGTLSLQHFNPAEVSPGEFAQAVVRAVEDQNSRIVIIDSLSGFLSALPNGRDLITQMHSLLSYLSRRGVLTILTLAQHGLLGGEERTEIDASYLVDSAILLRLAEVGDEIRRTVAVVKKRHGDHERAVRELMIGGREVALRDIPAEDRPMVHVH